ncbi:Cytoplasmic polyadenylation element-binding protein [Echinococcus granulosus]|uniref:Cytoplasmic polyadenylation element-binding protein n=1 Tax=Echinococcus granulosus TaxID=6210 RepID=W6UR86_ECHGR|nr:Cytoplasmic polyadenylation element-binding protein [Echinococcus granulosus]EUB64245.1 Cytoplasmic polyadenylation element-binding protein [Echinococcus granulosus]
MTGDFDVDQKSQLCGAVDSTVVKGSTDDTVSKQTFNFASSFQNSNTKSSCRGDVIDDQSIDSGGTFCRQGLGDHLTSQNRISSSNLYCNDQTSNSTVSDAIESNIESLKALSLKSDNATPFQPLNSGSAKTRDMTFSTVSGDGNPFSFERSQSAQKFDSYNYLGDTANTNSGGKSHSTPESSSGIESAYSSTNPRNQLLQETENPPSTGENHLGGCSSSYWNTTGSAQTEELNYLTTALSVNSSPLLTNLLFQQPSNSPVGTKGGLQSNSGAIGTKRPIVGGHQGMRPLSRPPGWNPTTTSLDSNFTASSDQSPFFTPTSTGFSSKAPGWMGHFSPQNSSYPWSSTASQQNAFKSNFADATSGFSSGSSINGLRFGGNNSLSNMGSNGFSKGPTSSNPASLYSMFSKRPPHRVTAHWQQQQHHQQHMQQTPPSILSKQHSSDFSSSGPLSIGGQDGVLNQKMPHGSFGSNSGVSPMASGMMSGNMDSLNADRYSSYGFDQHLIELMKTMDSSGSSQSGLLDDLAFGMPRMDNYHGNLHSLPGMSQSRPGLMSSGLQNQGLHGMGNAHSSLSAMAPREEGYSRKVFVGGLPPDIDEEEQSVQNLINACIVDEGKYYWCVSSPTMKDKPVQIRPWNLADSDFVMDGSQALDPRKTIFVGGVPRPLRAIELALIMDHLYGGVCYAGIDIDPELKYPKGAGRVAFSNQQSYISAISARFVQLQHNDIDKRVEVKPYVLDNQMCDECQGARCGGKFAPLFCANVTCLQYYCEQCWVQIHSRQGREYHKPLVKEGAERPRPALYRCRSTNWSLLFVCRVSGSCCFAPLFGSAFSPPACMVLPLCRGAELIVRPPTTHSPIPALSHFSRSGLPVRANQGNDYGNEQQRVLVLPEREGLRPRAYSARAASACQRKCARVLHVYAGIGDGGSAHRRIYPHAFGSEWCLQMRSVIL